MLFQPFNNATQRKGSAVEDALAKAKMEAIQREIQGQNIAGAASLAKWGLDKETSPWADAIYGEAETAPATPVAEALRTPEVPNAATPAGPSAVDLAMSQQGQGGDPAGLLPSGAMAAASLMTGNPMGALPFALQAYNMYG